MFFLRFLFRCELYSIGFFFIFFGKFFEVLETQFLIWAVVETRSDRVAEKSPSSSLVHIQCRQMVTEPLPRLVIEFGQRTVFNRE